MIARFRARILAVLTAQIQQGATARSLSLAVAAAVTCGAFPLLGFTTLLCLAAGSLFRLNHPTMQIVNYLMAPAQLLLIPVWLRTGEMIVGADPIVFSPSVMMHDLFDKPSEFLMVYGRAGLLAVMAWALCAPLIALVIFTLVHPGLRRLARRA